MIMWRKGVKGKGKQWFTAYSQSVMWSSKNSLEELKPLNVHIIIYLIFLTCILFWLHVHITYIRYTFRHFIIQFIYFYLGIFSSLSIFSFMVTVEEPLVSVVWRESWVCLISVRCTISNGYSGTRIYVDCTKLFAAAAFVWLHFGFLILSQLNCLDADLVLGQCWSRRCISLSSFFGLF